MTVDPLWLIVLFVWHGLFAWGGWNLLSSQPQRRWRGLALVCIFGSSMLLVLGYGIVRLSGFSPGLSLPVFTVISLAPGSMLYWKLTRLPPAGGPSARSKDTG